MENKQENQAFRLVYAAEEQEELKAIRQKYLPPEQDKMQQIRKLDAGVTGKARAAAIGLGVLGMLVMGLGMSCCMVWQGSWFAPGIVIGLVGMAMAGLAYPAFLRVEKRERQRIAPEILRLTEELMK
ncbi:MAG: hypothetical protein ACI4O0_02125 [Candidatus Limivicinus sp.]